MTESRKKTAVKKVKRQMRQSASERYSECLGDIGMLLDLIGSELKVHAKTATEKPKDWGYPGDLAHIRESLKQVLVFLLVGRYGWSETEASRFFEEHAASYFLETL